MGTERIWVIGNDPSCNLVVDGPTVSGRHCCLRETAAGFVVEDLGSTNGTYVNQRRIQSPTPVQPADHITLGKAVPMPWPAATAVVEAPVRSAAPRTNVALPNPMRTAKRPVRSAPSKTRSMLIAGGALLSGLAVLAVALVIAFGNGGKAESDPKELARFFGHHNTVRSLAVSPDGAQVVSGDADGHVAVWEAQSRQELGRLSTHGSSVNSVAISPDGKWAAGGSDDAAIRIWDLKKLQEKTVLRGHEQAVTSVVYYPAGTHLLSGGRDGRIILWNLDTEKPVRRFSLPTGEVRSLAMMPDGIRFVSGDSAGVLRVWELSSGREVIQFKAQKGAVNGVAVSPLGDRAMSAGNDGALALWDLESKRIVASWNPSGASVRQLSVAFSVGGTRALSTDSAGGVWLWSCEDNQLLDSYSGHTRAVLCCAFFPNGAVVLTGSADQSIRLWRMPLFSKLEEKKISEVVDDAKRRAEKFARFGGRMALGREYLEQKKLEGALAEFEAAAGNVDRDSLEFDIASDASKKTKEAIKKKRDYQDLCETAKAAADREDYEKAMHEFELATAIFPDRPEADEGYKKASKAWQLKQALDGAEIDSQLGFTVNAPSHGALHKAKDFAFLLVRKDPPMALVTTPLAWTIQVDTPVDFPDEAVRLKVQLSKVGSQQPIAVVEHPFVRATKRQVFLGEAKPPNGGWTPGSYEMSTSVILAGKTKPQGDPSKFDIGILRWQEKKFDVTPEAVQRGNFSLGTGIRAERGDALSIEATGTVAPASVQFYKELLADKKIADPVPSKPTGIKWLSEDMRLRKFNVVDIKSNFAALLVRVGVQGWIPYIDHIPPQVLPASGQIELSINSVVKAKLSVSTGLETMASTDQTYWRPESGKYVVTLHHGKFDFPETLPLLARVGLLKRFEQ